MTAYASFGFGVVESIVVFGFYKKAEKDEQGTLGAQYLCVSLLASVHGSDSVSACWYFFRLPCLKRGEREAGGVRIPALFGQGGDPLPHQVLTDVKLQGGAGEQRALREVADVLPRHQKVEGRSRTQLDRPRHHH